MMKPPELLEILRNKAQDNFPEVFEVMERSRLGEISQEEALGEIAEIVSGNPKKSENLLEASAGPFKEIQETFDLETFKGNVASDMIVYTDAESGQARLNPLYEALLAERIQFDGDIPELRFGPMPKGAKAAVPVITDATNPVAIGKMLADASERVTELVLGQQQEVREGTARMLTGETDPQKQTQAMTTKDEEALTKAEFDACFDIEEYRRREVPMFQEEPTPSGKELTALDRITQQEYAFRTISTTPGRRSAAEAIWKILANKLIDEGLEAVERWEPLNEERLLCCDWVMDINEARHFNHRFSYIDLVVQRVFLRFKDAILNNRDFVGVRKVKLRVETIDDIPARAVGWRASMIPIEDPRDWGLG